MSRKGDWIGTYTGKQLWPLDPRPEEVCLEDIAHALSQICRFNGHANRFCSVAHHCLNVERILEQRGFNKKIRLYGLLHDAAEAYICDIPRPLKQFMPEYKTVEINIQQAIYKHFGLPWPTAEEEEIIKAADDYVLALEAKKFMRNTEAWNLVRTEPGDSIQMFYDECWKNGIEYHYYYRVSMLLDAMEADACDA